MNHEQNPVPIQHQQQLALPMTEAALDVATVRAMRRLFQRRWVKWHRCKRFEEAVADPLTCRLLILAVIRGRLRRGR